MSACVRNRAPREGPGVSPRGMDVKRVSLRRKTVAVALACTALFAVAPAATAGPNGIVTSDEYHYPDGTYNGVKVFLSSPRHSNSGSRGECYDPGREENWNGRRFNWYAADGNYYNGSYTSTNSYRNLTSRNYWVVVSRNTKDDGFLNNRQNSQAWGSDVHIITHTNAHTGCPSSASHLVTEYTHSNDNTLASRIGQDLDPATPAGHSHRSASWAELQTNATYGDAYVEVVFHDNQPAQEWMYYSSHKHGSWRYGWSVDKLLGYPR